MEETFYTGHDVPIGGKYFILQPVRHRFLEQRLRNVFERFGFSEITTPAIEFNGKYFNFDLEKPGQSCDFINKKEAGIYFRPDLTTSIAKIVATYFRATEKPLRFYYIANSFFSSTPGRFSDKEACYAGAEIIGTSSADGDIEMMIMAIEALQEIGLSDFHMDLGHVAFWNIIFREAGFDPSEILKLNEAFRNKSFTSVSKILHKKKIPEDLFNIIINAPFLRGKNDLLNSLRSLSLYNGMKDLLDNIEKTCKFLEDYDLGDYFTIDLSLLGHSGYYSGYVFEFYLKDQGFFIGSGGRYDRLLEQFSYPCSATGFSINLDYVLQVQEKLHQPQSFEHPDFFVTRTDPSIQLFKISRELRRKGFIVEVEITDRNLEESLKYARKRNIKSVMILRSGESESKQILLKNMETDDEAIIDIDEFLF